MSSADLRLAADSRLAIARSAVVYGYTLDSSYDYKEIACPLAPSHMLLSYESAQPNGAASRFTAIVPMTAEKTPIQIISISRFGSVPFLPAWKNPHTIELFNRVAAAAPVRQAVEDDPRNNPLLVSSLCYLAMIGEPPTALTAPSLTPTTVHAPVPTLEFREKGTVTQVVSVRNSRETYQVWNFTFDRNGRLLAAERTDHAIDVSPPILNAAVPGQNAQPPQLEDSTTAATPSAATVPALPSSSASPAVSHTAIASRDAAGNSVNATATAAVSAATPAVSVAPNPIAASPTVSRSPVASSSATPAPPAHASPAPTVNSVEARPSSASAAPPIPAKIVPLPQKRLIINLPLPPSRVIPDGSLPYPPRAPVK